MHRFFVPADRLQQQPVVLSGAQARQMQRVLRLRPGAQVILFDNTGHGYEATVLGFDAGGVRLEITAAQALSAEPGVHVSLYQAVMKGERFEWLLQKGTELGISRFVPIICARSVVADRQAIAAKSARWGRIIQEAAEQSGRSRLPELAAPQSLAAVLASVDASGGEDAPAPLRLIAWEDERAVGIAAVLAACNLQPGQRIEVFVGPEGGLTGDEIGLAIRCGLQPISLGPRILRAETAGLVAAVAVLYHAGDLNPRS